MKAGRIVTVQMTPNKTPFAITKPISWPNVKDIVHMAKKPAIVVSELPVIEEKVLQIARTIASSSSGVSLFLKTMQQKNGKIHRHSQLQYGCQCLGDIRNLA